MQHAVGATAANNRKQSHSRPRYVISTLLCSLLLCTLALHAEPSVRLAAVGDVMVSRTVTGRLQQHGVGWAWQRVAPLLAGADLRCCNLECAVTERGVAVPKRFSFRADPDLTRRVLQAGHFSLVSLANNHTWDYGRAGLARTLEHLQAMGMPAAGAGVGRAAAVAPRVLTCGRLKIAFVAYTCWTPERYLPADDAPCLATLDETTLTEELRAAKAGADLLVVSLHWGREYAATPSPAQQRLAHRIIDAGADLILGHHPHVAQPAETYHARLILYSLGNCLFDRSGPQTPNGALALVRLSRDSVRLERLVKLRIEEGRPVVDR